MNPKLDRPKEDENPFEHLKIGNWEVLNEMEGRSLCKICSKSRKYFCYTCYIPVTELEGNIPRTKLPIKIDIIKHAREIDGKSTAAHAAVLAPDDVKVSTYPFIPEYGADERVVLIYPAKNATSIDSLFHSNVVDESSNELSSTDLPVTRAVFIDSTWNQSKGIYKDPRLRALPCVILQSRLSQFWRHQKGSPRWYLATVEAVHQFLVELHTAAWLRRCEILTMNLGVLEGDAIVPEHHDSTESNAIVPEHCVSAKSDVTVPEYHNSLEGGAIGAGPYDGQYDNLLFFFRFMYSKIHNLYSHDELLSYKRRLK